MTIDQDDTDTAPARKRRVPPLPLHTIVLKRGTQTRYLTALLIDGVVTYAVGEADPGHDTSGKASYAISREDALVLATMAVAK